MLLYKKFGLQLNRKSVNCWTNRTKFSTRLQINSSRNGSHTAITDINRLNSTQKIARLNHIQVKILSEMMFLFHSSFSLSVRLSGEQRGDILTEICFVSILCVCVSECVEWDRERTIRWKWYLTQNRCIFKLYISVSILSCLWTLLNNDKFVDDDFAI